MFKRSFLSAMVDQRAPLAPRRAYRQSLALAPCRAPQESASHESVASTCAFDLAERQ